MSYFFLAPDFRNFPLQCETRSGLSGTVQVCRFTWSRPDVIVRSFGVRERERIYSIVLYLKKKKKDRNVAACFGSERSCKYHVAFLFEDRDVQTIPVKHSLTNQLGEDSDDQVIK